MNCFSVDDVEKASIAGLKGLQYLDKTLPDTPKLTEDREKVVNFFLKSYETFQLIISVIYLDIPLW